MSTVGHHHTIKGQNVPIRIWAPAEEVDSAVIRQLKNVAALPWVAHHVAVMPDVHAGRGATVGSVIAMHGAVAPAAVGVDIGCGMTAVQTSLTARDLPDDLRRLRSAIEKAIPVGRGAHRRAAWEDAGDGLRSGGQLLMEGYGNLAARVHGVGQKVACQLGTLGGGNHFIEVCLDTADSVWLMLHSGSRHIGALLAEHHIDVARRLNHNQALEDRDLAVFLAGTAAFAAYRRDLFWAQEYARFNRDLMMHLLSAVVRRFWPRVVLKEPISCHHNYVAEEVHFGSELLVTRKGAIRAGRGQLGIIPGSMGTRSYIVRGLGNPASFESASHGAGRRMSRTEARQRFSLADLQDQTEGVECRKDRGVIDEAPRAYKDIDRVMEQQRDLVEIVAQLKQVVCVKGG
jgi:tRNA-splicing ligase RtcB (3'-phosphate/5'-hydroxy nucleic acid ligase)